MKSYNGAGQTDIGEAKKRGAVAHIKHNLSSMTRSTKWSFTFTFFFPPKPCMHSYSFPYVLHAPPISSYLLDHLASTVEGYLSWTSLRNHNCFEVRSQNFEKRLLALSWLTSSFRMELGSQLKDFHENLYLSIFRKPIQKIQVPLKYAKNEGYFTWRPMYIFYHISLNSS